MCDCFELVLAGLRHHRHEYRDDIKTKSESYLSCNIQEQKFDNPTRSMQKIEARSKTCSKRQMKDRVSRAQYVMGGV